MNGFHDNPEESESLMSHSGGRSYTMDSQAQEAESAAKGNLEESPERDRKTEHKIEDPIEGMLTGDTPLLSQFHEDAIQQAGMGPFQRLLLFLTGLGLAADTIELFVVAYVIPSAEVELCMSGLDKGWLAAITFVGMMIGAIVWGTLSDNIGRRRALMSALFVNAVFGLMTAFMPTYGIFITTRLCSGIGIGGSIPIVFAYYSEFVTRTDRGRHLSWLLVFWAIGGVFTAIMAWVIIPRTGITVVLDEQHHFSSWRLFLVVCSLPSFVAVLGLYFMPESPRFLLEQGRDVEAMMVYKRIFKWNHAHNPKAEYQLTELELPSGARTPNLQLKGLFGSRNKLGEVQHGAKKIWNMVLQLFLPQYLNSTIILLIVWGTSSFGFYGLAVWFPEYIKLLQSENYDQQATIIKEEVYEDQNFNNTRLDNIHYINVLFNHVSFNEAILNHVVFQNCSIFDSSFSDIRSSKTFFRDSYIAHNKFVDTDFYDYRFQECEMINNTFRALVPGCELDFDYNIHYKDVFQANLIGQLTLIPGTIIASLVMDKLGRARIMGASMLMSSVACFFIWFLNSKTGVIVFEAIFNFLFIAGWNAMDIATTEAYPAHIRTTAYGLLSAIGRIAAIFGSLTFGRFIYVSRAIPMMATSVALIVGGVAALNMRETRDFLM